MADPAAAEAPVLRRPKRKLILIGALVLGLLLALAAATVVVLKPRAARAAAGDDESSPERAAATTAAAPRGAPVYLPLDPFVVNLADRDVDRYAQIGITLEIDNGVSGDQIKAYMPAIRNAVLLVLANKTSKELLSREGKEQLAQEIMREAVRPMGIEIAAPEPVTAAAVAAPPASAAAASAPASATPTEVAASAAKPKPRRAAQRNPIQHVHFSSFIVQ
jgi:flagellar FliL protein